MPVGRKLDPVSPAQGRGAALTPYATVNTIIGLLAASVRSILGDQMIGMYLDGSLANGDFDESSDLDFIVVTRDEVTAGQFAALQQMHAQIGAGDSPWALELEGSYISQAALRRYDPARALHPNLERGAGEQLKLAVHDASWLVHRQIMRQHGIVVLGPPPHTLIDPIAPEELRQAALSALRGWAPRLLEDQSWGDADGYHSYIVLTLCRILYTIASGSIASKRASVAWAQSALPEPWHALIERAWIVRQTWPERQPDQASVMAGQAAATRAFIRHALAQAE